MLDCKLLVLDAYPLCMCSHMQGFEHLLDTLDASHAAELVQTVCSRMHTLATSKPLRPVMVS